MRTLPSMVVFSSLFVVDQIASQNIDRVTARPPVSRENLEAWLKNMVCGHHFSAAEVSRATGLAQKEVEEKLAAAGIVPLPWTTKRTTEPIRVLPYPGGRHPRIGFREGAIDPQRETKVSVFLPWTDGGYVVVDAPEAIFSNLGLTYLAHTHVPTLWSKQGVNLAPLEWQVTSDGGLLMSRRLPNAIEFSSKVSPQPQFVDFEMTLTNGTEATLSGLRVQVCLMLKMARGFEAQSNANKRFIGDYAVCHDQAGQRWIIVSFRPTHRTWGNPPCPCIHADPKFRDTPPGKTSRILGRIAFYEGPDIVSELVRIDKSWSRALDRTP